MERIEAQNEINQATAQNLEHMEAQTQPQDYTEEEDFVQISRSQSYQPEGTQEKKKSSFFGKLPKISLRKKNKEK